MRFSARSSNGSISGRKNGRSGSFFSSGRVAYILKHMEWRKKIFLGIGILSAVIGSIFGWGIWMNADRSEIRAWESSTEENLFGTGNAQIGSQSLVSFPLSLAMSKLSPDFASALLPFQGERNPVFPRYSFPELPFPLVSQSACRLSLKGSLLLKIPKPVSLIDQYSSVPPTRKAIR